MDSPPPHPVALAHAVAAGAARPDVAWAWQIGEAAEVPIGHTWDVLRVTRSLGRLMLAHLRDTRGPLGPVLDNEARAALEFLIPPGQAAEWSRSLEVVCTGRGVMLWPAPGPRAVRHRSWIVPPVAAVPATTDSARLHAALTAARAARQRDQPPPCDAMTA